MFRLAAVRVGLCAIGLIACGEPAPDAAAPTPGCREMIGPITEGFGARGPHEVATTTFANPRWPDQTVSVHLPSQADVPHSVVFFAHAFGVGDPESYGALIDHMASRGHAVIFSPYAIETERHEDRYGALWSGFAAAVRTHREQLDLERVGFVGHSYGAGAIPFLAHRGLVEEGWGARGAFLYLMAPWYALNVTSAQMAALPQHLLALVQVFEDDTANDHRIAIDIFHGLGIPASQKEYVLVRSDRYRGCRLHANHTVPQSTGFQALDDGLDYYAVFRLFDALAASAFRGDEAGRRVAIGHGRPEQVAMGVWPDGTAVRELVSSRDPRPVEDESHYIFQHGAEAGWRRYGEGD